MSESQQPGLAYWSGEGGDNWARQNEFTEAMLAPVMVPLIAAASAKPGERVVDTGCGCGALALALAKAVGPQGRVLGIDVSPAMLAVARHLTPPEARAEFVEADATTYAFPRAGFDLLASRHGVMFFADPERAFANLRTALKPGGRLAFSCFRTPRDNPWATAPLEAAYQVMPRLPKPGPEDPGPFSFADPTRVERILGSAGFAAVTMTPHDLSFDIAAGGGLETSVGYMLDIGPASRTFDKGDPAARAKVEAALRAGLKPHVKGKSVLLGAGIWIVTARNS
ncbi:MAG: methyltransferase domain-containing protein [Alphaproteobacteria bacterium]|nr:methyltransferase domain-containing protein [Alphaproteobacteria bacterium]MDE2512949.1 methyltransferase domain-containing protein [Alphaproteobacteria bacterium]